MGFLKKIFGAKKSQDDIYAEKIFKMVEHGMRLINPVGKLYSADKDFLSFELTFFYYFIYDYKIYSQLDGELRKRILDNFFKKLQSSRSDDFKDINELDNYFEKRIAAYFTIIQEIQKIGEFGDRCANYINTLLSFSEKNNAFTAHNLEQAENELKPQIVQNKYTEELKVLLTVSCSPLMINGIDPTEVVTSHQSN